MSCGFPLGTKEQRILAVGLKQYKFTLISVGILVATCFIGNIGHIILAGVSAVLILIGELFCNKTLKQFEQKCNKEIEDAKREAAEMLKQYQEREHKCNCNGKYYDRRQDRRMG